MIEMHNQDFRTATIPEQPYVIITDPPWPVDSAPVTGCDNASKLLTDCAHKFLDAQRFAIILGCNVDPGILPVFGAKFFRMCWLPYAVPGRWGRLLQSGDVGYLYGNPPKSEKGRHIIPGEGPKAQPHKNGHPCPRALEHMKWLVWHWARNDEVIIDPFAGSGTTLLAAQELGMSAIGYEVEQRFCDIAKDRLSQMQMSFITTRPVVS